jgi:hypothetical protein
MPTRAANGRTRPTTGPPGTAAPPGRRPAGSGPAGISPAGDGPAGDGPGRGPVERPPGVTLRFPFLTARFEPTRRMINLPPGLPGRVPLPSPVQTAYYAGLGALAVTQLVEWPVAAAIAAGTYIAQHTRPQRSAGETVAPS